MKVEQEWFTLAQAEVYTGMSRRTIGRHVAAKRLKEHKRPSADGTKQLRVYRRADLDGLHGVPVSRERETAKRKKLPPVKKHI